MNLQQAREFCAKAHGAQTYGSYPYSFHLAMVERVATSFGFANDTSILKAIWGHDVLEDTATTKEDLLAAGFSSYEVALIVAVTDGQEDTRQAKKLTVYGKICQQPDSIIIKLCDRIANLTMNMVEGNLKKYYRYRAEQADFENRCKSCLANDTRIRAMWRKVEYLLSDSGLNKLYHSSIDDCFNCLDD